MAEGAPKAGASSAGLMEHRKLFGRGTAQTGVQASRVEPREAGLIAVLLALAAACWIFTSTQLNGMDMGVWTDPGALGLFTITDFILHRMRPGYGGALRMIAEHGAWCVACCGALMAALFALGVMSLGSMAHWAFIAAEKMLPWKRLANRSVSVALAVIALGMAVTPAAINGMGM
ncbi:putative metal-binding membrane protein [Arthrobacter sp. UYEF21]